VYYVIIVTGIGNSSG